MWLANEQANGLAKAGNPLVLNNTNKKWWNICNKDFSYNEANAVCRDIGLPDGIPLVPLTSTSVEDKHTFQIESRSLSCPDNATGLADCIQTVQPDCREDFLHSYASVLCVHKSLAKNGTFIS